MKEKVKAVRKMLAFCLVFLLGFSGMHVAEAADTGTTKEIKRYADVVFAIDTTGSMGDEIKSVKENLTNFINDVKEEGVDVRVKFICFRDVEYYNSSSTSYSDERTTSSSWYQASELTNAIAYLNDLKASGGGDGPETSMDALAAMMSDTDFGTRSGVSDAKIAKFCILLTDADYKNDFETGASYASSYGELAEHDTKVNEALQKNAVNTSVITRTTYFPLYSKFVTEPTVDSGDDGGILADITGDYSIILEDLAKKVVTVTYSLEQEKAIKIKSNMVVFKKYEGASYSAQKYVEEKDTDGTVTEKLEPYISEQASCVVKGLEPETKYEFKIKKADGTEITTNIKTESATGARFSEIPAVVYEGEVYNIKTDNAMKKMLTTTGSSVTYSCASDCVKVTNDEVGNGCKVEIIDCQYNGDKLIKVALVAEVQYNVKQADGTYRMRSKKFQKKFSIENEVDAIEIGEFFGTTENIYQNGIITLTTKNKVWLDVILNQGEMGDTPSKQKLVYFMSDKYGFKNKYGTKIAKVNLKGQITGVNPGVTYLTIAVKNSYNKYANEYQYSLTVPVVCPQVDTVEATGLEKVNDSRIETEPYYVVPVTTGAIIDLKEHVTYNPTAVFNKDNMKTTWITSDKTVATVKKGVVKFRAPGYVTISLSPVGGYEIDAATGKRRVETKPYNVVFKVLDEVKE